MEAICLKMEEKLVSDIDKAMKYHRYSTRTEFIRDAIRSKLSKLEKEEICRKLAKFKGSLKGKARMSEEEAGKIVMDRLIKKYDIKLD